MTPNDAFSAIGERLFPGARLRAARRLTGGVSAEVHALELETRGGHHRTVVVRQHLSGEWKSRRERGAETEYGLLRAVLAAGVPVPEPLLLDTSLRLLPRPFVAMSFIEGTTDVPADRLDAALDIMAAALARVHGVPADGLPDLPLRVNPLPELFDYLLETPDTRPLREHLGACTDSAYTGAPVLLHGDFWPGNLLWRNGQLAAILDWEDSALGDPLSDVASCRLELFWKHGPTAMHRFTRGYARERAVDARRLALWEVYVATAGAHFMGAWGLAPEREAEMRSKADAFVRRAAGVLLAPGQDSGMS